MVRSLVCSLFVVSLLGTLLLFGRTVGQTDPNENPQGPDPLLEFPWRFKSKKALDARSAYSDSIRSAKAKLLTDLDVALKDAVRQSDIDEAVRLREAVAGINRRGPTDAASLGSHKYKLIKEQLTWHQAKGYCEARGGYLACIHSPNEDLFIRRMIGDAMVWLGATDEMQEGRWRWINHEPFIYASWKRSEPNNDRGVQHYAACAKDGWDDGDGGWRLWFVCEWDQ